MLKSTSIVFIFFLSTLLSPLYGQNQLDNQGLKTGRWLVTHPNGKTAYEATFIAGKPVGMMKRYNVNGELTAEMMFDTISEQCYTRLYHQQNKLAAEGWYVEKRKDSVWTYYSEFGGHVILREPYETGILQGTVKSYYPNGQVTEQTVWKDNEKNGTWIFYFDDGGLRSKGYFINGMREGEYTSFFTDSTTELHGNYKNDLADGEWKLFNEDGTLKFIFKYENGKLLNESELLKQGDEVLRKLQDLPDPDSINEF